MEFRRKTPAPDFSVPSAKLASSSDDEPVAATLPPPKRGRGRPKRARVPPRANPDETTPTPNANSPDAFCISRRDRRRGGRGVVRSRRARGGDASTRLPPPPRVAPPRSRLVRARVPVSEGFRRLRAVVAERQVPRDTLERHCARGRRARRGRRDGARRRRRRRRTSFRSVPREAPRRRRRRRRRIGAVAPPPPPRTRTIPTRRDRARGRGRRRRRDQGIARVQRGVRGRRVGDVDETRARRRRDAAAASLEAATPRLASRKRAAANARVGERAG